MEVLEQIPNDLLRFFEKYFGDPTNADTLGPTLTAALEILRANAAISGSSLAADDKGTFIRPAVSRVDTIAFAKSEIDGVDGDAEPSVITIYGTRATVTGTAGVDFDSDASIADIVSWADTASGSADAGFDAGLDGNNLNITHEPGGNNVAQPTFTDTAVDTIDTTTDGEDAINLFPNSEEIVRRGGSAGININPGYREINDTTYTLSKDGPGVIAMVGGDPCTVVMPVVATYTEAGTATLIRNTTDFTGYVRSSDNSVIQELAAHSQAWVQCITKVGTDATSWWVDYVDPSGTDNTSNVAGEAFAILDLLYMGADFKWYKADNSNPAKMPARGVAMADAAAPDDDATVRILGNVKDGSWTWSVGTIYAYVTGGVTQTPPSGGAILQQVGYATSATTAYFDFNSTTVTTS